MSFVFCAIKTWKLFNPIWFLLIMSLNWLRALLKLLNKTNDKLEYFIAILDQGKYQGLGISLECFYKL